MSKYRVYWTETVSCFMDVEENSRPEAAEKRIRHLCQIDSWQDEISRSKPMPNPDSFDAVFISD